MGTLVYSAGGLVVLFCWLLWGDFAYYMRERSVIPSLKLLFYKFEAPDLVVGLLLGFLPQALTLILLPIVSYRSDRHRGRWGRRIPFLLVPTPVIFVAMLGMAFSPELGHWLYGVTGGRLMHENGCVILAIGFSWTLFELGSVVCGSVFHGLFSDVVPREVIGRFWALFRVVNLIDGMIFNYFLLGHVETHYTLILGGIGLFYLVSFTLMCLKVKEGAYPPPPPAGKAGGAFRAIKTYFRDCFTQPFYLWYFAFYALVRWAVQPLTLFLLFFAKSLDMDIGLFGKYATAQMGITLLMSYPAGWLVDKFDAVRVSIVSLTLYAVLTLLAFFLVHDSLSLGLAVVICGASAGFAGTAYQPLGIVLLPRQKFAEFNSASGIGSAIGLMLISPLCGWFFDVFDDQYHYIYLFASLGTFLAVAALIPVYRTFKARGGSKAYVAP